VIPFEKGKKGPFMMDTVNPKSPSGVLPSYKKPPIDEVVSGLRFHPSQGLTIPHIGLIWDLFRKDYPNIQLAPPIFDPQGQFPLEAQTGLPLPRTLFINKSDDQLIQLQVNRFYFNWRRRGTSYPRYPYVIKEFEKLFDFVKTFFERFELGVLKPVEYELTYINQIPKGQGWDTIDDLPRLIPDFNWRPLTRRFLPTPEKVSWATSFHLPESRGDLKVNLKQGTRILDKVPVLLLELKASGPSISTDKKAMLHWFDLAHEWIVRGFTDLTAAEAHKLWEREDA
jgi:uncharacterized protein (TIGR04255 family)